jgi:hypothetical protein
MNEQEIRDLRAGDGVVTRISGNRAVVRFFERGVPGIEYTSGPMKGQQTLLNLFTRDHFRRETFREFLIRPDGFGETKWVLAVIIFLGALLCMVVGSINIANLLPQENTFEMSVGWGIALLLFGAGLFSIMLATAQANYQNTTVGIPMLMLGKWSSWNRGSLRMERLYWNGWKWTPIVMMILGKRKYTNKTN